MSSIAAPLPHLHIFMPEVFAPLALWQQDFGFEPGSAALMTLLAKHQHQSVSVSGLERSVLHWLGMDVAAQLPWAALRHQFESGEMNEHGQPLLCADPVFMRSGIDSVTLDLQPPELDEKSTAALLASLNQHLAQDGLVLKALHPQRWYLYRLDECFQHDLPLTTPLSEVGTANAFPYLPQSADKYWTQLFNEIQMLLYSHPVNQAREGSGLLPVNGLWFWGEGDADVTALKPVTGIYGGGISGQVIAHAAEATWSAETAALVQNIPGSGDTVVILDQLRLAALSDQPKAWQTTLNALEADLNGLLVAQRAGRCDMTVYDAAGNSWLCGRPGRWPWPFRGRKSASWGDFTDYG